MNQRSIQRAIAHRSNGHVQHGINRLASPADLGQFIKPFVFLDHFAMRGGGARMRPHPHSGIATLTIILDGSMYYRETTGSEGVLGSGAVEWMNAGGGVWHEGGPLRGGVSGFQLWIALPEQDELRSAHSHYASPSEISAHGPARVVLGSYGGAASPLRTTAPINYLHVRLADGERWIYTPPAGHTVGWLAVSSGALLSAGTRIRGEIAVFEEGEQAIEVVAEGATEFVLGSAVKHPHDLVMGYYSVHTSAAALAQGEAGIDRLGAELRALGKLAA